MTTVEVLLNLANPPLLKHLWREARLVLINLVLVWDAHQEQILDRTVVFR